MKVKVTQSCRTLCDPWDYTVHGILQARILEWVAFPIQGSNPGVPHCRQILYQLNYKGSPRTLVGSPCLLQGIYPTQESNQGLLQLQADSLPTELSGLVLNFPSLIGRMFLYLLVQGSYFAHRRFISFFQGEKGRSECLSCTCCFLNNYNSIQ